MLRYKLRTLLIVLAVAPALVGVGWWAGDWFRSESENRFAVFRVLAYLITILAYVALVLGCVAAMFGVGIGIVRLVNALIVLLAKLTDRR